MHPPYIPASGSEPPPFEGTSKHPFMLDSDSDSSSDFDPLSGLGVHQWHAHYCPGFQVNMLDGQTPFVEWPWLEYEHFAMSMSVLLENGTLTLYASTCTNDGQHCQECQNLKRKLPITCIQD